MDNQEVKKVDVDAIFAPEDYVAHWDDSVPDEQYHADKTAVNYSSLKKMDKSPKAFYASYFLGKNEEPTEAMKFGTLAHMAILQGSKFKDAYVVMPEFMGLTLDGKPSAQSKDAKQKRAAWLADQPPETIITTIEDRDRLFSMIDSILSHRQAHDLLKNGKPEIAGYWRDPETGLRCRMKLDFLPFNVSALLDLKTTQDSLWEEFRRSVESLRYDIQIAMYSEGVKQITGIEPEHKMWMAVESKMPFEVACYEVPPQYEATGKFDLRNCLRQIAECAKAKQWPQRQAEVEYGDMSPWFFKKYELKGAFSDILIG